MRVLLDSCLSGIGKEEIKAAGHEVIWSGDWKEDPGDETILAYALKEARVLVTGQGFRRASRFARVSALRHPAAG